MSGLIGIPCAGEAARYSSFYAAIMELRKPPLTSIQWARGAYVPVNRNELCQEALNIDAHWLLMTDDDHVFEPDMLLNLLAVDAPIVVPVCLKRTPPFHPVLYHAQDVDGQSIPYQITDIPNSGTMVVEAAGTGVMLIRREVLDAFSPPWFELERTGRGGLRGEDLIFSRMATAAGFPITVDCGTRIGHASTTVVWPTDDGVRLDVGNGRNIVLHSEAVPA